ncbi:MAG: membrane protein insertase YidC [Candidatus Krumholzibacteria bacterium]|nr:membrane protein insertase YidC [Candidatus Krumholzibacteria bacterium]
MDRRTLLAFVLIFLILAGYPYLMNKFFPQPEKAPEQLVGTSPDSTLMVDDEVPTTRIPVDTYDRDLSHTETTTDSVAVPESEPLNADQALALVPGGVEETISVKTPLFRMDISTLGGRITQWEGMKYDSWLGGPVKLVPENIPQAGVDAVFFRGGDLQLGGAVYQSDRMNLDLGEGSGPSSLTLTLTTVGGLEIRKIFTFRPDTYGVEVDLVVAAPDAAARHSLNLAGSPDQLRFGWNQGIAPTERVQKMELPSLRSLARIGEDYHYKKRQNLKKSVEKVEGQWRGSVHFAGLQNKYFAVYGIVPQEQGEPIEGTIRLSGNKDLEAQSWAIDVPAQRGVGDEIAVARLDLFIGPMEAELLQSYGQDLEKSMDLGMKFIRPLSEIVLLGMEFLHRFIPNFGLIIIIFSVLTKLAFYPLTQTSTKSMKKMQELQPKMTALKEKYKNDKDKLNQATMELYKEEKVNPLTGCLPMVVQMPVFFALYQALNHTISLRGQPFVLWINDLSQPDAIAQLPFSLPFLGADLNVLPILMSVAMYFQTKLTPTSGAGGQMAAMNTMMPLIMVFIFYNMPSGLVLYWLINTLMQGYQTWKIHQTAPTTGGKETT